MYRKLLASMTVVATLLGSVCPPALGSAIDSEATAAKDVNSDEEILSRARIFRELLEELRANIKRSSFDLEALLEDLDWEPSEIVKYVTTEIGYEQYPGVLRGAAGTLMSAAGNSADQSLLLASLLKDAGVEARIARGPLEAGLASRLVKSMRPGVDERPLFLDERKARLTISRMEDEIEGGLKEKGHLTDYGRYPEVRSQPRDSVKAYASEVASLSRRAGLALGDQSTSIASLIHEAKDYFWVQWRPGAGSEWQSVHPAFGAYSDEIAVETSRVFVDEIPREVQHTVSVRMRLDRSLGGATQSVSLGEILQFPTANLDDLPLVVATVPGDLRPFRDVSNLGQSLDSTQIWVPFINGSPGDYGFDLLGNTVDISVATGAAADFFQSLANGLSEAVAGLGGEKPRLEALWLEYQLDAPNGRSKTFRTDLISDVLLKGPGPGRSIAEKKAMLTATHSIMFATGRYPDAYLLDVALSRLVDSLRVLPELRQDATSNEWASALRELDAGHLGPLDFYSLVDAVLLSRNVFTYRNEPSIVTYTQMTPSESARRVVMNVVSNGRLSLAIDSKEVKVAPERNLEAGVLESVLEAELLLSTGDSGFSAASSLLDHQRRGEPFELIRSSDSKWLEGTGVEMADWIRSDVEAGYVVLIPDVDWERRGDRQVWWRIHPETGETLAMMSGGYGGVLTEYQAANIVGWAGFGGFAAGFLGCVGGFEGVNNVSASKGFQCALCGVWAGATAALAIGACVYGCGKLWMAYILEFPITVPAGVALKAKILAVVEVLVGYYCGGVSASG